MWQGHIMQSLFVSSQKKQLSLYLLHLAAICWKIKLLEMFSSFVFGCCDICTSFSKACFFNLVVHLSGFGEDDSK